ncbi:hypothetical protein [Pseudomonas asplenii]|uniref:hypothetical protein n=1 Tax=Pseudomonas asplenii TaxID=53407 RepID=UPI0006B571DE|nr:hypothetical protein [Pseudomonas fuscovaginae]
MRFINADVVVHTQYEQPVILQGIASEFKPGDRSLYVGVGRENNVNQIMHTGWLCLESKPFPGWQTAHTIQLTCQRLDQTFEVKSNFNVPVQEGDWLRFPVKPKVVTERQDQD